MNNQLLYIGLFALSVTCVYLMYQNTQLKKKFKLIQQNQKQKKAIEKTKANQKIEPKKDEKIETFNNLNKPQNATPSPRLENNENINKTEMTYNILKTQYENYSNSDQYDSNSEDRFNSEIESDLKEKIDLLDKHDNTELVNNSQINDDAQENHAKNETVNSTDLQEEKTESHEILNENTLLNEDITLNKDITLCKENAVDENIALDDNITLGENIVMSENIALDEDYDMDEKNSINIENVLNEINNLEQNNSKKNESDLTEVENLDSLNIEELTTDNLKPNYKVELTESDIQDINMELSKDQNTLDGLEELKDIDNLSNNNLDEIDFFKKPPVSQENNKLSELEKKYTLKELQKIARDNNIKIKGKKEELIERFIENKINF